VTFYVGVLFIRAFDVDKDDDDDGGDHDGDHDDDDNNNAVQYFIYLCLPQKPKGQL
jgi:hypothetical protein